VIKRYVTDVSLLPILLFVKVELIRLDKQSFILSCLKHGAKTWRRPTHGVQDCFTLTKTSLYEKHSVSYPCLTSSQTTKAAILDLFNTHACEQLALQLPRHLRDLGESIDHIPCRSTNYWKTKPHQSKSMRPACPALSPSLCALGRQNVPKCRLRWRVCRPWSDPGCTDGTPI
jgi:hypothetical protein